MHGLSIDLFIFDLDIFWRSRSKSCTFWQGISWKWWRLPKTVLIPSRVGFWCYNFTPRPWITFWRANIWNVDVFEMVRAIIKLLGTIFVYICYLVSTGLITTVLLRDIDSLFAGQTFESLRFWSLPTNNTITKLYPITWPTFCRFWSLPTNNIITKQYPITWPTFFRFWSLPTNNTATKLYPITWPTFSWAIIWNVNIIGTELEQKWELTLNNRGILTIILFSKMQMITNLFFSAFPALIRQLPSSCSCF